MAEKKEQKVEKKKGGILRFFVFIAFLVVVLLGFLTYLTFDPQDLSDIEGYRTEPGLLPPAGRNIGNVLAEAEKGSLPARITEEEINNYLVRTLKAKQEGVFENFVELKGVWVRLEDGVAEVIIERELMSERKHTIAMFLEVEQKVAQDGQVLTLVNPTGGRFGRTEVVEGYLHLVVSAFKNLGATYDEELEHIEKMFENKTRLEIKEGELVITPPES